jgi:hypothetical protein
MRAGQNIIKLYLNHLLSNNKIVEDAFGETVAEEQFDKGLDSLLELIGRYKGTQDNTQPAFFTIRKLDWFIQTQVTIDLEKTT